MRAMVPVLLKILCKFPWILLRVTSGAPPRRRHDRRLPQGIVNNPGGGTTEMRSQSRVKRTRKITCGANTGRLH